MASVAFITLGCPKNEVDSERMRALVASSTHRLVDDITHADVAVLNTCGFITAAVEEAVDHALDLIDWRDAVASRRLIIAGCMVSRYGSDLHTAMPEADAFLPLVDEATLLSVIDRVTGEKSVVNSGPTRIDSGPSAYLQLSDGCFRTCAYCTIPAIRGPYRSRSLPDLLTETELLISNGAREIVCIGQDISSWGRDLTGPQTLTDVVRAIAGTHGLAWLRLMYTQPDGVTGDLLETMAALPQVCHYLDIPLQHASPTILKSMGRSGSPEEHLNLVSRIRQVMPDVTLRTSVIAGFPGETDRDVETLESFLREVAFDYVGVFPFSPEEGTRAATLPGQLPEDERLERAQLLRDTADSIGFARAETRVGTAHEVLSEGFDEDGYPVGRTRQQAPEVDGIVTLDIPVPLGEIVLCNITDASGYDLTGEVVQ
ncbi:MAG: 30S ribosomal protein S12 methylthiotransferase RimO [Clostridiales bacterium]|nr:30S ribosomal protein S12 methylthiotransferase RimO [Clostridiales bacterium]